MSAPAAKTLSPAAIAAPLGEAFGAPGIPPRWTRGAKDAIGTAYSASSRVWFTLAQGTLTEIYYPTVDRPQVRDLQFLFTDGETFFHGERRDCDHRVEGFDSNALGFRIESSDRQGRYHCHKEVIADPHLSCILLRARIEVAGGAVAPLARRLRCFVLAAPHLDGVGWHNCAEVFAVAGRTLLLAHRNQHWMAIGATAALGHASAGYVGASDGWTDLAEHLAPTFHFATASDGNVALSAEIDWRAEREFTLGVAFGDSRQAAINALLQSLEQPFAGARARFAEQWARASDHVRALEAQAGDGGALYRRSVSLLHAHEDKTYPGALIASLSIPWGEVKGDEDLGGYHLVWTRDLVNSACGLLASGDEETPRRALIYLSAAQRADGGFAQNFWINGTPYWQGIQLDEVAFPILLAWRLRQHGALAGLDPYPLVAGAAAYLMRHGPATPEERWEEAGGYSPSSLAAHIAGLVCAADFARERGQAAFAQLALEHADFLEAHLEAWTVTRAGTLVPGIGEHYIRINPAPMLGVGGEENPDSASLRIANRAPGEAAEFPAREIVDAGFLELARYGVRPAGDPLIEASLRVVDAVLKVETPFGPCWHRYNHDGYGQRPDGGAFTGYGRGGAWPLLTGERGHYELAAGRGAELHLRAMEQMANHLGLLPEQIWDLPDRPAQFLRFGRPSGSAMPLMWAHAEYIRLLRSRADGIVFDLLPPVAERYGSVRKRSVLEIWKLNRQLARVAPGTKLRVQLPEAFFLHFSRDGWATVEEQRSIDTGCGFEQVDVAIAPAQSAPLRFTFRYAGDGRWQGQDYAVAVQAAAGEK
ncbi:MAG: glycoside hydrolase family 15 protein [Terriglobales bacterium]